MGKKIPVEDELSISEGQRAGEFTHRGKRCSHRKGDNIISGYRCVFWVIYGLTWFYYFFHLFGLSRVGLGFVCSYLIFDWLCLRWNNSNFLWVV